LQAEQQLRFIEEPDKLIATEQTRRALVSPALEEDNSGEADDSSPTSFKP